MLPKLLRRLLLVGYAGVLAVAFVVTAYLSFSTFVRRGEFTVPNLRGMTLEEARSLLAEDGITLSWHEDRDRFDPEVPRDGIIEHSPRSGNMIKRGGIVEAVLSRGRRVVEVPDLESQTLQTAELNLRAAGLTVGRLVRVFSDAEEERVVRQSPSPGSHVDHLAAVDLFLSLESSARSFVMPDLVYRSYDTVRRFFESEGFRIGSVKYEPYEGIAVGVVLRQFPLAGHRLARHDVISLVVAAEDANGVLEGGP